MQKAIATESNFAKDFQQNLTTHKTHLLSYFTATWNLNQVCWKFPQGPWFQDQLVDPFIIHNFARESEGQL